MWGPEVCRIWYVWFVICKKKSPSSPGKEDGDSNSRGTTSYYQSETDLSAISLCKQLICSSLTVGIRSGLLGSMGEWPVHPDSLQGMFFFCMAASHHPAALWTYSPEKECVLLIAFSLNRIIILLKNFTIGKINKISIKNPQNLVVMIENDIKIVE